MALWLSTTGSQGVASEAAPSFSPNPSASGPAGGSSAASATGPWRPLYGGGGLPPGRGSQRRSQRRNADRGEIDRVTLTPAKEVPK